MSNKQYSIIKYITGGCWIATGILGYCNNDVADAVKTVLHLALLLIVVPILVFAKTDKSKEGAAIKRAKAFAASVIHYIFCLAAVLTPIVYLLFKGQEWNWMLIMTYTFFIMMGAVDICTGFALTKLIKQK